MSKLGKHIYIQGFDRELNIDYNYAIFSDSFTLSGVEGFTAFGSTPSVSDLYYDYSSITNWSDVRDTLTVSLVFVRDEIKTLYIASGGSASYAGLTYSDKEALSKNFLVPKSERDLIHTEQEQRDFAAKISIGISEFYKDEELNDAVNYLSTSDDEDINNFLENPGNFIGSGGGGSVSSVNGQSGTVILDLNDLADVNTSGVASNHVLTHNGINWVTDLRPRLKIHPDSQNYMNFNSTTGELYLERLAITDVTVNTTATSSESYFSNPTHCASYQEGDTVVFTGVLTGTEIWMHSGGSTLTIADYVMLENPNASDPYIRNLLSEQYPITYNNVTGVIGITQSGTASDGYLSMANFNYFNNKVDTVNGKVGTVILTTSDIVEGTNKYYCAECAYLDFHGATGINYDNTTGTFWANINDSATGGSGSDTSLWSAGKIYQEILLSGSGAVDSINGLTGSVTLNLNDINDVDTSGSTSGHILSYNGTNWVSTSGNVTGAGTPGYLATWNTSSRLSTSIIRDNGTNVAIGATADSSKKLLIDSNGTRTNTGITTVYTGTFDSYGILLQGSGTSTRKKYGISVQIYGGTQNIGILGAAVSIPVLYPDNYDIGVLGGSLNTNRGNIGVVGITTENTKGDNIAGYFEASNGGTGSSYVLKLIDGNESNGRVLTSDANGFASWQDPIFGTGASSSVTSVNGYTGLVNLNINDLADVDTITATPSTDYLLRWDGSNWSPISPNLVTKKTWTWGASSNSENATDSYLYKYDNTPTNISPYVSFNNCKILNMSASTNVDETWIAEARINGVPAATMSISATTSAWDSFNISVNAGDKITLYCNGTSIDTPSIEILLQEI